MGFLEDIIARKTVEVAEAKKRIPLDDIIRACSQMRPAVSLKEALVNGPAPRIIAEIKRSSPSKGRIRPDLDAARTAREYRDNGAAAISVLTDGPGFGGSISDLRDVYRAVGSVRITQRNNAGMTPILRKDFLIDPYQVWESRAAGADAVLLIVAALGAEKLDAMMEEIAHAGMEALVETHDEEEMRMAADAGAGIIGINNRDLRTFKVDPRKAVQLAPLAPKEAALVIESGMKSQEDVRDYIRHGFRNFLIGEALMMAPDIGGRLKEFVHCTQS